MRRAGLAFGIVAAGLLALAWGRGALPWPGAEAEQAASLAATPDPAAAVSPPADRTPPPADTPQAGLPAAVAVVETGEPSFDVVRVEPDGSALVAGRAEPDEAVTVRSGERVVAQGKANADGEFVIDFALPVGQHRLNLGAASERQASAFVNVPAQAKPNDLLVMMERPGEASRIVARPSEPAADPALPPSAAPAPPVGSLSVEAVEIENRQVFVAGSAPNGASVRIYLDDEPIAQTRGGEGDRFVASVTADVEVGEHRVRADKLGEDGSVIARVEVPFDRPDANRMAAVAPPPSAVKASEQPANAVQAALEPSDARVIIRRGDSLWRISRGIYGRGSRYTVIYLANGDQIRDPNRIYPGQVFRTPADAVPPRG